MTEDAIMATMFFSTIIVVTLGLPLVRAYVKRREQEPPKSVVQLEDRLARMETSLDAMALEIERISEGQRFVTRLLAESEKTKAALPDRTP